MISIAYICSTLEQTGPTSQLFNILSGLDRSQFVSCIITLSPEKNSSLKARFDAAGFKVICIDPSGCLSLAKLQWLIDAYLVENNVDVVHTQGIRADGLMSRIVKNRDITWVATLRNIPYLDYPAQYGLLKGYAMAVFHLVALRSCSRVVVVSQSVKASLQKFFPHPVNVIANGIDTQFYCAKHIPQDTSAKLKQSLSLSSNERVLVYTGILEERKNLVPLLDEVVKCDGFRLVLVGEGRLRDELSQHPAVISNQAILVGSVQDVRPFLAIADAFILLSKAEGLPNSALEALALNCPVILSDIGPHREIAELALSCVHLIDLEDSSSLSTFLNTEFSTWRNAMSAQVCRDITVSAFSSLVNSTSYQSLYTKYEV
ncbi:glycosyltransferase [Vibrio sp. IRLE0018]|uniref:glycosyltransferase n=1 Tax=Vibrio floridensis TaxID=2908007 RepID=UPI001F17BA7F|nr:glycosyltransferase [Vibrio floridensis]